MQFDAGQSGCVRRHFLVTHDYAVLVLLTENVIPIGAVVTAPVFFGSPHLYLL